MTSPILEIKDLTTEIEGHVLHRGLNLSVNPGEIVGIIGGSGSGKSVLLQTIFATLPIKSGDIRLFDVSIKHPQAYHQIRHRYAVLFQNGALFSSLTVAENILMPLREVMGVPEALARDLMFLKLEMVGLSQDTAKKYPAELSGGMIKRVALARALAGDAELIFLDEPTAGLDPISAQGFDALLIELQEMLNLTVIMVTHDLDTLRTTCDRVAILIDKSVRIGTINEMAQDPHPWIQSYFHGTRGRALQQT